MDVSSAQKLCLHLICCAIQRCRMSEDLCRLTVAFKCSPLSDPPVVRISISDTGVGSSLEEFRDLKFAKNCVSAENWDGIISVATTNICDNEIFQYHLNLKEVASTRRFIKLPSNPKCGAKFSGTEVSLSTFGSVDDLLMEITPFFRKLHILKIYKVAIELVVERSDIPGSQHKEFILANESVPLSFPSSNIDRFSSGFEDYVYKHGNNLDKKCHSCFPGLEHVKVGSGRACCAEIQKNLELVIEAVIVISEFHESSSACFWAGGSRTEVLYFKDFSLCSIPQSSLPALTGVDWKSYGLTLKSVAEQDGCALLVWENLPLNTHIDIALHCYHKQVMMPLATKKTQLDRNIIKTAIKFALDDLKERNRGVLLSAYALQLHNYAPDLAKSIAGLILSSNDSSFQGECFSLLGLQCREVGGEIVEDCIKEKIISVIEMNDRKPQKSREAAPFLFADHCFQEPNLEDEECIEGEELYGF